MELKQLRYFVTLANELHFQRAARLLCVTQPALSQQIKNLESKLEQSLFERDRQSVSLTPAGKLLLDEVSPILVSLERAIEKVRYLNNSKPEKLTLCVPSYVGLRAVNKTLIQFRERYPQVELQRVQYPSNEIQNLVRESQIDGGFTPNPITHPALVMKKVVEGNWSLLVPKTHLLAKRDELPAKDIQDVPLILFARELNPQLHDWVLEQIREAGSTPTIAVEATQVSSAIEMVHDGIGCYLVVDYLIPQNHDLHVLPVTGFTHPTRFLFVWHEDNPNPALKAFVSVMREVIESPE